MSAPNPQKLFGTTNELAKERNRAAAERTMNAWIGNCLTLIGFGIALDQIYRGVRRRFPDTDPLITEVAAHYVSIAFIGMGVLLLALALVQHRLAVKSIEREDYVLQSVSMLNHFAVGGVLLTGIMGLAIILLLF